MSDSTAPSVAQVAAEPEYHVCHLCWRHADKSYDTTPFFLGGVFYPSTTRRLCQMHYKQVLGMMIRTLRIRIAVEKAYEEGGAA